MQFSDLSFPTASFFPSSLLLQTDLCSIDGDEEEGPIHCHGVAWATDDNDPSSRMRFNNLFFVSLYDHMYQRGYVGDVFTPGNTAGVPMCGCIEEMPVVSRSDCTQINAEMTVVLDLNKDGHLTAGVASDLEVNFNACQGETNNDLASYVDKLVGKGKMSKGTQLKISEVLVGDCSNV